MAAPSPFTVAEQTPPGRTIVLRGRSLPHRPVMWGGESRVSVKYFPGNPVATAQVIGPVYTPTVLRGRWSDAFLYQGAAPDSQALRTLGFQGGGTESAAILRNFPALSTAVASVAQGGATFVSGGGIPGSSGLAQRARILRDAFELLRRGGQLLRVQWGSIVRYGFLTRCDWDHDREEDIAWEMEFTWIGDTDTPPRVVRPPTLSPLGLLRRLQSLLDQVIAARDLYAFVAQTYFQRAMAQVAQLNAATVAFLETLKRLSSFTLLPAQALGSVRQQIARVRSSARDVQNTLRAVPAAYGAQRRGSQTDADDSDNFTAAILAAVARLGGEASTAAQQIARLEEDELLGVHVMVEGTTLRDVSTRFYGTPDEWPRIAEYNGLEGSIAPAGAVLRIPKLRPTERTG